MEKIYKITNRKIKQPNPKNDTTIEKQYQEEQKKVERKKEYLENLNNFRTILYTGNKSEKQILYQQIQNDFKHDQDLKNNYAEKLKKENQILETKNFNYNQFLLQKEKEEKMINREKFRKMNQENINLMEQKHNLKNEIKKSEIEREQRALDYSKRHYKRNFL